MHERRSSNVKTRLPNDLSQSISIDKLEPSKEVKIWTPSGSVILSGSMADWIALAVSLSLYSIVILVSLELPSVIHLPDPLRDL